LAINAHAVLSAVEKKLPNVDKMIKNRSTDIEKNQTRSKQNPKER